MNKPLPPYYNTAMLRPPKQEREHNHEEDLEREQRRMESYMIGGGVDRQLDEKDEEWITPYSTSILSPL